MSACDPCLRRALLIAMLAARIAGLLDRPAKRVAGLLALPEAELIEALGGERSEYLRDFLDARDLDLDRERFAESEVSAVCRHAPEYPPQLEELADARPSCSRSATSGGSSGCAASRPWPSSARATRARTGAKWRTRSAVDSAPRACPS